MVHLIDSHHPHASYPEQMEQMLEEHNFYIKVAVDIERQILAGGGHCTQTANRNSWMMTAELQRLLSRWQRHWNQIWTDTEARNQVALIAKQASERVLEMSGLLPQTVAQ